MLLRWHADGGEERASERETTAHFTAIGMPVPAQQYCDAPLRVLVRGFHFLWQMKLKLLCEACVGERLAEGLE